METVVAGIRDVVVGLDLADVGTVRANSLPITIGVAVAAAAGLVSATPRKRSRTRVPSENLK